MPRVRVSLRRGKPAVYRKAIPDGIYRAMIGSFEVPEEDRFLTISEHDEADFSYSKTYLDIPRSDDLVIIQITANNTRTVEKKKRFSVGSLTTSPPIPACDQKTFSSTSSNSLPRTGRSARASRNTPSHDDATYSIGEPS